jgi:hypothetical protein
MVDRMESCVPEDPSEAGLDASESLVVHSPHGDAIVERMLS